MSSLIDLQHARKLRFLRKTYDKKQIEIADFLSVSQQAYSKLERAETTFSDEIIEKISNFFNMTPAEFELPLGESITIGSNNSYTGSNINNTELTLINALNDSYKEMKNIYELLIQEKDARIKSLEENK